MRRKKSRNQGAVLHNFSAQNISGTVNSSGQPVSENIILANKRNMKMSRKWQEKWL